MPHNTMWDGVTQRGDGHAGLCVGLDVTGQPVAGEQTEGAQGAVAAPRRPAAASGRDS